MFKKLTSSIAGISLLTQATAHGYSNTFDPAEFVRAAAEEAPLSIRVGPQALSPDILEKLSTSSNIIFADLPNSPQFVSLKDYESIKFATNELLDELMKQDKSPFESLREQQKETYSNAEANVGQAETSLQGLGELHQKHPKEQELSEAWKPTASTWKSSTSEENTGKWSSTVSSTTATAGTTSSETKHSSSSFSKSTKKPLKTSESVPHSTTKSITSKHYERSHNSSIVYPTSAGKHSGNHSNHTNSTIAGFDNSSNSIVPTTMFFAFLLTILLFMQSC